MDEEKISLNSKRATIPKTLNRVICPGEVSPSAMFMLTCVLTVRTRTLEAAEIPISRCMNHFCL